jgi:hypothetical protein
LRAPAAAGEFHQNVKLGAVGQRITPARQPDRRAWQHADSVSSFWEEEMRRIALLILAAGLFAPWIASPAHATAGGYH